MTHRGILLVVALLALLFGDVEAEARPKGSTQMNVKNLADHPVELFWINIFTPEPHELVAQTTKPIRNNTNTVINSYDTHSFKVKYYNPPEHLEDVEGEFTKGPDDEEILIELEPDTKSFKIKQLTAAQKVKEVINKKTDHCVAQQSQLWTTDPKALAECMTESLVDDVVKSTVKAEKSLGRAQTIGEKLRNYTCEDPTVETSSAVSNYDLFVPVLDPKNPDRRRRVHVDTLLDTDAAKIWVAHNFVTDEECDILMRHGQPRLMRATVADADGTSVVSESRKAQQANYMINMDNPSADPLYPLYARVFQATNHHTKYNLSMDGQEDFTIIQYNVADQYTPHCDGSCDGEAHVDKGRVASSVMYCKVADQGGGTTFTNVDVFVKPTKGMATFFSYKDKKTGLMDDGDTQHSGCPVLAGEKWITTVWMREGVSKEHNWNSYDPSGLPIIFELQEEIEPLPTEEIEQVQKATKKRDKKKKTTTSSDAEL